ncbi:type VI secretion protein [Candidatus Magnetomorum sp. HK-1]|nr:type VI secretion protein [Candidatus Magnetomorum sp. HK-1]
MNFMINQTTQSNIFDNFKYYSFYKAVEHLEQFFAKKPLGKTLDPGEENIRFAVKPDLGFPATDIVDLKCSDDKQALMEISFLGLVGPSGVLPSWYNELAIEIDKKIENIFNELKTFPPDKGTKKYIIFERLLKLKRTKNWQSKLLLNSDLDLNTGINLHSSLSDFFNIFHHRLITFYYLAWKKTKLPGFNNQIDTQLLSFTGLNSSKMINMLNTFNMSIFFFNSKIFF